MIVEKLKLAELPQLIPEKLAGVTDVARLVTVRGAFDAATVEDDAAVGVELVEVLFVLPQPAAPNTISNVNTIKSVERFSMFTYLPSNLK